MTDCVFAHCVSTNGGTTVSAKTSAQTFVDCIIADNLVRHPQTDYGKGAGINFSDAKKVFRRCAITNNYTTCWAAGGIQGGYASEWYDCIVSSNSAGYYGGAYLQGNGTIVSNCVFSKNVARIGNGGGLYIGSGTGVRIFGCAFVDNEANSSSVAGLSCPAGTTLCNSLFARNRSVEEPTAASVGNGSYVENVTVVGNRLNKDSGIAGIKGGNAETWFYNVVFADNWNNKAQGHTYCNGTVAHYYKCHFDADATTYKAADSTITTGDPKFVDAANGDYRVTRSSPLKDMGEDRAWMQGVKDLGGKNDRIIGLAVDIGCYEYSPRVGLMMLVK